MIEKLTKDQEAQLSVYADKWIEIGRCIKPTNRKRTEQSINWMYANAGMGRPVIIHTGSPMENVIAKAVMEAAEKMEQKRLGITGDINEVQWQEAWAMFQEKIAPQLAGTIDEVWAVAAQMMKDGRNSELIDTAKECFNTDEVVENSIYGQHEAHWLAFYEYFHDVCELVEETKELHGLWILAKNAGWMLPYVGICFVSERHDQLHFDENDRLHNEASASIHYPDGFGTFHWHGVRVTEQLILQPETLTKTDFVGETNAEVRRAMIERTEGGILSLLDMKLIDANDDPEIGSLYEFEFVEGSLIKVMKLKDSSTDKEYWIYPKPEVKTIEEAHSSIAREVDFLTIRKLVCA